MSTSMREALEKIAAICDRMAGRDNTARSAHMVDVADIARAALSSHAPDSGLTEDAEIVSNLLDHYLECYNGNRDALAHSAADLIHRLSRQPEAEPAAWGDSEGRERPIDAGAMKQLRLNPTTEAYWSRFSIPLYTSPRLDREKVRHILDEMLMGTENYFGAADPKREGRIHIATDAIMRATR